jgi:hypothetical protein
MRPARIVSGGQTGVDRGALDAALAAGWPCGGWCPADRAAEDGAIPARYPVVAIDAADPSARTRRNVEDSDATLILCHGGLSGGTLLTARLCETLARPCLIVDAEASGIPEAVRRARDFTGRHQIEVLNVAGPRQSGWPGGVDYARSVIRGLLTDHSE